MTFSFPLVGFLIAVRRPGNAIAWILLGIGVAWGLENMGSRIEVYGLLPGHSAGAAARVAGAMANFQWLVAIGLTGTFLLLLFPDGHLAGPRWRWVAGTAGAAITLGSAIIFFMPGPMTDAPGRNVENPFGIEPIGGLLDVAHLLILLVPVCMVLSAVSLVRRYRRSTGVERVQIKWLVAAAAAIVLFYAIIEPLSVTLEHGTKVPQWIWILQNAAVMSLCLIPISIGFAVLRYHLYDIDVIIRRTLIYAAVVAVLAVIYLTSVTVFGEALRRVTGQSSALAVTVSTLLVLLAFRPLQRRVRSHRR